VIPHSNFFEFHRHFTLLYYQIRTTLSEAGDKLANAVRNVGQNISKLSSGDVHYFESSAKIDDVKKLLELEDEKQKLDGMKQAISVRINFEFFR
jgi:hypothetical protein